MTNRHKVIKSENSPVFLAHPVYESSAAVSSGRSAANVAAADSDSL